MSATISEKRPSLTRGIGKWGLVLLLINAIIGAGIFGLPSSVYQLTQSYSLLSMAVCALIVFFIVLTFAEVGSRFDGTGGPYLYSLEAFGQHIAFLMGWILLITRVFTFAALMHLLVTYLAFFFPFLEIPLLKAATVIMLSLALAAVNLWGIKNSASLNNFLGVAKLVPLLIFILAGFILGSSSNVTDSGKMPDAQSFSKSALLLIFAFSGFEAALVNTGEVENPQRHIPRALFISFLVVTAFYCLIQYACMLSLPGLANSKKPLSDAAYSMMGNKGAAFITLGAVVSIAGTLNSVFLIGSRLPFALSEHGQFPRLFSRISEHRRVPVTSLWLFFTLAVAMSVSGSFVYAATISASGKVLTYLIVCLAFFRLRKTGKGDARAFRLPLGKIIAGLGLASSLWLLSSLKMAEWQGLAVVLVTGFMIYIFCYRRRKENMKNKEEAPDP